MTDAALGQQRDWERDWERDGERDWGIPAYLWPPLLGVSVAVHLSLLVFGLPERTDPLSDQEPRPETEVVIESGGLAFQDVAPAQASAVEPAIQEIVESVAVPSAPAATPEDIEIAPVAVSELAQVIEETPLADAPAAEIAETVEVAAAVEAVPPAPVEAGVAVTAVQEITAASVVAAEVAPEVQVAPLAEPAEIAAVESGVGPVIVEAFPVPDAPVPVPEADVAESSPPVIQPVETDNAPVTVSEPLSAAVDIAAVETVTPAVSASPVDDTAAALELAPAVQEVQQVSGVVTEVVGSDAEATTVEPAGVSVVASAPVAVVESTLAAPVSVAPGDVAIAGSPASDAPTVSQVVSVDAVEVDGGEVDGVEVTPQEIAPVAPAQTVVAALDPSEPDAADLVSVAPPAEPAQEVAPQQVATIDPLARVSRYVEDYRIGDCAHLSVLAAGADSASVSAFGSRPDAFMLFDRRFKDDQGYEASIQLNLVTEPQCALLNALGVSGGLQAAGLLDLDRTVVRSGASVSGIVQRDLPLDRIAAAEAGGLDLGGKGAPELYLIDNSGKIHDGRGFLLPASDPRTAGGWRFSVPVTLVESAVEETALLLAIWNRPAERQPARFSSLPAARLGGILEAPGVYSLTAFKVSP